MGEEDPLVKTNEPPWELDCRCKDCEIQRSYFGRTFEETQKIARERLSRER